MSDERDDGDIRDPRLRDRDFLGAFAVIEDARGILMVENRRRIGGQWTTTWDLPGGQVEPRETLREALRRELREELGIEVDGAPRFLFYQEGERVENGARSFAWRSFFFAVTEYAGEPRVASEIVGLRWLPREAMRAHLHAPYHDSFLIWLAEGGAEFTSAWRD